MEWMILPLKRYADFEGRSRRMEYWMFTLFIYLVAIALTTLVMIAGISDGDLNAFGIALVGIGVIAAIGIIIPSIAVVVRRLHDRDMSGWFYLISFVPYVGGLIIFVFMVLPGTPGPNRYGEDPLDPTAGDLEATFR
jgi:uncharacterized membrane protein YhaH (DUF805 family)